MNADRKETLLKYALIPDDGDVAIKTTMFIARANIVHEHKYTYSTSIYINESTPVEIECKEHGKFHQTPAQHITQFKQCPTCIEQLDQALHTIPTTRSDALKHIQLLHQHRAIPSSFITIVPINFQSTITIVHETCQFAWETSIDQLRTTECARCNHTETLSNDAIASQLSNNNFIVKPVGSFKGIKTKINIKHKRCGFEWTSSYRTFKNNPSCKKCAGTINLMETFIADGISAQFDGIVQDQPTSFTDRQRYDVFIPQFKIAIEYHGRQHYDQTFYERGLAKARRIECSKERRRAIKHIKAKAAQRLKNCKQRDARKEAISIANGVVQINIPFYVVNHQMPDAKKQLVLDDLIKVIDQLTQQPQIPRIIEYCFQQ